MTKKENELTIKEAAERLDKSPHTIRGWIFHKKRPLVVRRENLHKIYIDKLYLDAYYQSIPERGRDSKLPNCEILKKLKKGMTAKKIADKYKVTENAVWVSLKRCKN